MANKDELLHHLIQAVDGLGGKIDEVKRDLTAHLIQSSAGTQKMIQACDKLDRHLDQHEKERKVLVDAQDTRRQLEEHKAGHKAMRKWWFSVLATLVGAACLGFWNWIRINVLMNGNGKPPIHP